MISSDLETLYLLLGIINSKLATFYIKEKYASSSYNGGINFNKDMLNNFPIKNGHDIEFSQIRDIVRQIIDIKAFNYYADTKAEEGKIDNILYNIYELTADEISIVEQTNK